MLSPIVIATTTPKAGHYKKLEHLPPKLLREDTMEVEQEEERPLGLQGQAWEGMGCLLPTPHNKVCPSGTHDLPSRSRWLMLCYVMLWSSVVCSCDNRSEASSSDYHVKCLTWLSEREISHYTGLVRVKPNSNFHGKYNNNNNSTKKTIWPNVTVVHEWPT